MQPNKGTVLTPSDSYLLIYFNQTEYDRSEVFFFIMNQMEFRLVHNQKKNCHHDHIPFNLEEIRKK